MSRSSGGSSGPSPIRSDEWLDALQTSGGAIPESQLADLLEGVGDAIDAAGGSFTMNYVTFVVTAVRRIVAPASEAVWGGGASAWRHGRNVCPAAHARQVRRRRARDARARSRAGRATTTACQREPDRLSDHA